MDENEKWKLSKESDCPKCFEIQPYYWNAEINGSWTCSCGSKKFPKIDKAMIARLSKFINGDRLKVKD